MKADLGDEVPEALQEGVDLGLDGCGHAVPRHQVHILPLVLLCHPAPVHTLCNQHHTVIPKPFLNLTTLKHPSPILTRFTYSLLFSSVTLHQYTLAQSASHCHTKSIPQTHSIKAISCFTPLPCTSTHLCSQCLGSLV